MRAAVDAARWLLHAVAGTLTAALYLIVVVPLSRLRFRTRRSQGKRPRILWGPIPIINIRYSSLAERRMGYESDTLVYDVYGINDRSQFDYVLDRWRRVPVIRTLVPYGAFVWAGLRYDIFGFFFDGGLLHATPFWRLELALLKLARKKIVVYPYGGDARLASETRNDGRWHAYSLIPEGREDRDERRIRRRRAAFGRYADVVLGCADLVENLPRVEGVFRYPFDSTTWTARTEVDDGIVTVVHAPNHRAYKGTDYLISAVDRLRGQGLPIELVLVEGVTREDARSIYERADVVADQFLIGAYALFAIEGMALGKPVICFLSERFRPFHPEWDECPIVSANPDNLEGELRRLVLDPQLRQSLGMSGPAYVQKYHSLAAVGAEMDAIYRRLWR